MFFLVNNNTGNTNMMPSTKSNLNMTSQKTAVEKFNQSQSSYYYFDKTEIE